MANSDYGDVQRSGSGMAWFYVPVLLILFLGGALSVAAYTFSDTELTIVESIAAGFGGLAGIIVGLFGAVIGIIVGLLGAAIGVVAAGGAVAMTLFIIASPVLAIVLIFLLMRRGKNNDCPDPAAHE